MGDTPRGLLPDFRAGGGVVGVGVIRVVKLDRGSLPSPRWAISRARSRAPPSLCSLLDRDRLRRRSAHRGPTLLAHVVGHQQLHPVAFPARRSSRQRNTGVAAGRFDQHVAGLNFAPALFRSGDHRQRGAIFSPSRPDYCLLEFDPRSRCRCPVPDAEFDQWGIADGLFSVFTIFTQ